MININKHSLNQSKLIYLTEQYRIQAGTCISKLNLNCCIYWEHALAWRSVPRPFCPDISFKQWDVNFTPVKDNNRKGKHIVSYGYK